MSSNKAYETPTSEGRGRTVVQYSVSPPSTESWEVNLIFPLITITGIK